MRAASTYRGARRNATFRPKTGKSLMWEGYPAKYLKPEAVKLNRSQQWEKAKTYKEARLLSPCPGRPVR